MKKKNNVTVLSLLNSLKYVLKYITDNTENETKLGFEFKFKILKLPPLISSVAPIVICCLYV